MPPVLNPFLRAFFRSTLPSQCSPTQHHVLLVPTTDVLFAARDRDTNAAYADLSGSEEFLASHVLRVPGGLGPNNHIKDGGSFRDSRGKAKQYSTANGRTVIIKDAYIYSNKGRREGCGEGRRGGGEREREEEEELTGSRLQDAEPSPALARHHLLPGHV